MTTTEAQQQPATGRRKQFMRKAITAQCFGALGQQAFVTGILLLYLKRLELGSAMILVLLALPKVLAGTASLLTAWLADSKGRRQINKTGSLLCCIGFALIGSGGFYEPLASTLFVLGTICFSVGSTLFIGSWFAFLNPLIPEKLRGRFWGRLRFSWQIVALLFTVLTAQFLDPESPVWRFQVIIFLICGGLLARYLLVSKIPDLEKPKGHRVALLTALAESIRHPGYMAFCCYCFLLNLAIGCVPNLLGLLEKEALGFGDNIVVLMGACQMAGAMAGFFFSGTLIDRFGTRPVFVICHLGLAISILTLLTRGVLGFDYVVTVGGCILFFGLFMASSSVAITTEMMFLFPPRNKAISSALTTSMVTAGQAFSGLLAAGLIQLGALHGEWRFLNATLSQYDTLLLLCGSGVLVCTVTLGLIPSVLRKKSDWSQINANLT